jgi:hypothetical protein
VDDNFVLPDRINDQIIADGTSPKARLARRLAHVRRLGKSAPPLAQCARRAATGGKPLLLP